MPHTKIFNNESKKKNEKMKKNRSKKKKKQNLRMDFWGFEIPKYIFVCFLEFVNEPYEL